MIKNGLEYKKCILCNKICLKLEITENGQCKDCVIEHLERENEQLKKQVIVWHKVTCFAEPDENGYITADNPAEEGKEYLLKTKYGFAIDTLEYDETGFFFSDYDWKNIVAWAELQENKQC